MRYIESYVHQNKVGVLIELETPHTYTLLSHELKQLARELAMQIAAANPLGICREDTINVLPFRIKGAPPGEENTPLLLQKSIHDQSVTVAEKIDAIATQFATSIHVLRFARYSIDDG